MICNTAAAQTVVEQARRPYTIQISVSFASQPELTPRFNADVCGDAKDLVGRSVGPMWNVEVVQNDWLIPSGGLGLKKLEASRLVEKFGKSDFDKVLLVGVEQQGLEYVVTAREWDQVRRELGPVETSSTWDRAWLAHAIVALAARVFQPLLSIIDVRPDQRVDLRLWAGDFPAVDPAAAQIKKGDLLTVFFRYLDRQGVVRKTQEIAWTFLIVESVDRERVLCQQTSGMARPLGTRRRRRVEMMAVRVRPRYAATRFTFVPGMNPTRPLAAHRVEVVQKLFPRDKPAAPPVTLLTDRQGSVQLAVNPEHPLLWLNVYSGDAVLARLPCMPGLRTEETIPTNDDSMRLAVESELALLISRLIDTVARRATLVIQARQAADAEKWDQVDQYLGQLKALPGRDEFQQRLSSIRLTALEAARKDRNKSAELRIDKNCNDAAKRIDQFLTSEAAQAAIEDVQALRKSEAGPAAKKAADKSEK